jgi:dihydroorotate dehydrogenase (fumarate)
VVLPSLFEEQIEHDDLSIERLYAAGTDSFGEALSYLPEVDLVDTGPSRHLRLVEDARAHLTVPVIASLNGTSQGGWLRYARLLVDAGADALELNLYDVIVDPSLTASSVEARYLDLVEAVRAQVTVPLAVKIGPWFTAPVHFALMLQAAGADALVLFNRFYQPDIDLDTLEVRPHLVLSTSAELHLPLHWIGILRGKVDLSLAATTGVHTPEDVVRLLLAGADVTMSTSALLRHGPEHLQVLEAGVRAWMTERDYESVAQLRGSVSQVAVPDPQAFERANYVQTLRSWSGP